MKYSKQAWMAIVCSSTVLFSSACFAAEQGFTASVKAAHTSDDNVFREVNGSSDTFYTISPDLQYTKTFGKHDVLLGYRGAYATYDKNTKEDYTDHFVNLDVLFDLSKQLNVNFIADYSNEHESRGQSGVASSAALDITTLNKNSVFAGITFGGTDAKMQVELDYTVVNTDYTNNAQDFRDRRDDTISTRLFYKVGADTRAFVEAKQNNFDYLNSTLDSTEQLYRAGLRWEATAKTTGEVKVGTYDKNFDSAAQTDGSGTSYEAYLTWSPKTYSIVNLSLSRLPQESAVGGSFYTADAMSVNWAHEFNTKVAVNLDANQTTDDYAAGGRKDKTTTAGLGVDYKFRRWLDFGLKYTNSKRTSNAAANEFTDNTVMVSATLLHDGK